MHVSLPRVYTSQLIREGERQTEVMVKMEDYTICFFIINDKKNIYRGRGDRKNYRENTVEKKTIKIYILLYLLEIIFLVIL